MISLSAFLLIIPSIHNKYSTLSEILLSLSIIFLVISAIIYFLKKQFDKLLNIVDKIDDNNHE
jgi:hypothetical protein